MFNKSYNVAAAERANKELAHSLIKFSVKLLDDSVESFSLSTEARGQNLLDSVCDCLELLERDYFGLQYRQDETSVNNALWVWLRMDKLMRKQLKGDLTKMFYLRVRYIPVDINQFQETYTRYQLFLQIKQDIYNNRLYCSKDIGVQLLGCALQSELGDFNSTFKPGYAGEYRFIHDQTTSFESDAASFHKSLRGIKADEAENKFLTTAKQIIQYGCDLHNCLFLEKPIQFGFHALGISIFTQKDPDSFIIPWNSLDKVLNKGKSFLITVLDSQPIFSLVEGGASLSIQTGNKTNLKEIRNKINSGFKLIFSSNDEAKEIWKCCIENHSFFRVRDPKQIQSNNSVKRSHSFFKLTSVPSLFSGRRTLPELLDMRRRSRILERSFTRIPSKRYPKKGTSQFEKQSIISGSESGRGFQGKPKKPFLGSIVSNNKEKAKVDTKKVQDINQDEGSNNSDNDFPPQESTNFRPKSLMTQSVRLDKKGTTKEFSKQSVSHSSMQRKSQTNNLEEDPMDLNVTDSIRKSISKGEFNAPKNSIVAKSQTNITDTKSQAITKTNLQSKSKLTSSMSSMKNPLYNSNNGMYQSMDKIADLESYVEITMKPQDNKFGFTIRGGLDTEQPVVVTKVIPGSSADICDPNLFEGDQIIKINNRVADDLTNDEIKEIIRNTGQKKDNLLVLTVKSRLYIADDSLTPDISTEEEDSSPPIPPKLGVNDFRTEMRLLEESLKNGTAVTQFEKLYKQKQGLSMTEARKSENINKNRYKDILPYDQTRIIIRSNEYINANLIKFLIQKSSTTLKYIAAQGPLTHTASDFLTMVLENKTQLVVMLTDLQEKGRIKCFKYWPNSGETAKMAHGIQVTCESESIHSTYAIRELRIKKGNETKKFTHLQYINWPDHDVPQKMEDFISFMKMLKQLRTVKTEPIIVHCSAGIGRTGVVITMDLAIAHIELKQPFSVLAIVKEIRNQRAMLIQSQKQYDFVCRAIIHYYSNNSK